MKLFKAFLLLLFCNGAFLSYGQEWKTEKQSGYTIMYPPDWQLDDSKQMGTDLILFSAAESAEDTFRENVNIIIQDLKEYNLDLDAYTKLSEEQVKTMITNSKLVESIKITDKKIPYHKIIYTGDQGTFHLQFEQYYFVVKNKAYILTFTAEETTFEKFKKTGESILDSFVLKK